MTLFRQLSKFFPILIDFKPYKQPILGRWALHHNQVADLKADLTNEDHCGVCDKMRYNYLDHQMKTKK